MKRGVVSLAVGVAAVWASIAAAGEVKTLSGELVDLNCYLKSAGEMDQAYEDCAAAGMRRGQPLGFVSGSDLYIIKGDWTKNKNEKLNAFVGKKVDVTGDVADMNGKKLISITDVTEAQ